MWARETPVAEGAVPDHSHVVRLTPGEDFVLDGALLQMVEYLVADETLVPGWTIETEVQDVPGLFEIGHVEVAHAPGADLPIATQLLEGRERVLQRVLATPVQEVAVEIIGIEAGKRPPAGRDRAAARGIIGQDPGGPADPVAPPGNRPAAH